MLEFIWDGVVLPAIYQLYEWWSVITFGNNPIIGFSYAGVAIVVMVAGVMSGRRQKRSVVLCENEHEDWGPNEGCREFMTSPAAILPCTGQAIAVFTPVPNLYDPEPTPMRLCAYCAEEVAREIEMVQYPIGTLEYDR
ncbi:hypothetical protein [Amycolatopsis anabasis]|uniref:hypothetical protein n=1 Tax=Amycolatopsis anabasis TaxID=1840409 RepID=UPI00131DDDE5|nr:hypothetical protein [Amycolatopsis anabasis]